MNPLPVPIRMDPFTPFCLCSCRAVQGHSLTKPQFARHVEWPDRLGEVLQPKATRRLDVHLHLAREEDATSFLSAMRRACDEVGDGNETPRVARLRASDDVWGKRLQRLDKLLHS